MSLVELVAFNTQMQAVMLTVMLANTAAVDLYRKMGYTEHPSSPDMDREAGYLILHKPVRTRL